MWDCETNFDYLGIVSGERKSLLNRTCSSFTIPLRGAVLFFDRSNYQEYPEDSIWRNLGIHMNIELGDNRNKSSPDTVGAIIQSKNYAHLVWLSRRAWDSSEIEFVWNLSHELRHLDQDIKNRSISLAHYFLKYCFKNFHLDIDEDRIHTVLPPEKDAELAAWRTVRRRRLFGTQVADSYVRDNANKGTKKEIFKDLLKYDPNEEYDVSTKTSSFLRKYQQQFEEILNIGPDYYITEIGSIDDLCNKLSKKNIDNSQ
jgi:hypothetical protein